MAVLAVWLGEVGRGRLGILLALLNCLAAFTGTLMVAAGLYILLKIDSKLSVLEGYTSGPLPAMLISSGAVVAGIHLAGAKICLSVAFYRTRERCMSCLMLYQLAVIALFCLVIATSIMTTTHGSFADDIIRKKFLNAMEKYANDVKVKETIDLMQVEFRCCGGKGHSDWFSVPWINSKYMDPTQSRAAGDNVPWSCCDPEASRPCIHDRVTMEGRNYDPAQHLTLYATGCVEAIIRYQRNSVLKAATGISCAVLALQVVAFVLCRYLQTSIDTAYARGRPRSTTQGYFCARCPCSDASLSDIRSYSSLRSDTHRYHRSSYRHRKRSSSSSSSDSHKGKRLWHGLGKFGKRRNSSNYKLKHHPSDLSGRYHHHRDSDERQHRHHRDSDERQHRHHRDSDERRHHHHRDSDERRRRHRDSDSDDERNRRHKRIKSSHSLQLEAAERFLAETPHHADSDIGLGRGRGLEDMDIDISGHSGEGKPDKESKLEKKERKQTEKQEKKDKKQEKKDKKQEKKQEKKDKKQEKKDKKEEKKQGKKDKKQEKKDKKSERKNEKKTKKDAKKKEKEGSKDNKKREMKEKKEKKKTEKKEKKQTKDKDKKSGMKSKKSSDKKKNEKSKDKTLSKSDKKKEKKQKKSKDRKDASKNKKKKVTDTKAKKKSKTGKAKTKTKKEKSPRSKPKKTKMKKTKRPKSKLKKTKMKKTKRPKTKLKKHKIKKPKRSKFKRKKPKFKKPKHSKKFGSKKSGRRGMFGKKRR